MNQEIIREIKTAFRQSMNADLSNSMRSGGLSYKMNFGVPSPRIRLIASKFTPDVELARYLWNEDVRESKMLATFLFPVSQFSFQEAMQWIDDLKYTEIADQLVMNLLIKSTCSAEICKALLRENQNISLIKMYVAIRLAAGLLMSKPEIVLLDLDFFLHSTLAAYKKESNYLSEAAFSFLSRLAENDQTRTAIRNVFQSLENSDSAYMRNVWMSVNENILTEN